MPASSPRKLEKAQSLPADEVVLDLEDAIAPPSKEGALSAATRSLSNSTWAAAVSVRINPSGTAWCNAEVVALASLERAPATLVVPKVEDVADLAFVDRLLDEVELAAGNGRRIRTQALIETARGLSRVDEIAAGSDRLEALILGYADLAASLGRSADPADSGAWDSIRNSVLIAARSTGLQAIDGPYLGVDPDEGFFAAARRARDLGFDGKWAIHPSQIEPLNELFSATSAEIAYAERVLEALGAAEAEDEAGVATIDGQMIDRASEARAIGILARANVKQDAVIHEIGRQTA